MELTPAIKYELSIRSDDLMPWRVVTTTFNPFEAFSAMDYYQGTGQETNLKQTAELVRTK